MIEKTVLPNGVRILTERTPYYRGAVAHMRMGVGSGAEPVSLMGVAHVLEHMVFKGTPGIDQVAFGNEMARLGCATNAVTGFESTTYELDGPAETILQGLDLFASVLANFHVPSDEFEKEKDVIQEEWKMVQDDPSAWGEDLAYHALLGSFAHPTIGTPETIDRLTRQQVIDFAQKHYTPDQLIVGVAGHVEHAQVVEIIAKHFGSAIGQAKELPDTPLTLLPMRHEEEDCEQEQVFLGYRAPVITSQVMPAFDVATTILGGDSWARLFQRLRNELGLVYHVEGSYSGWPHVGAYMIYAGCQPSVTDQVLAEMRSEIAKLKANLTADELMRAKAMLRSTLLMSSDQLGNKVSKLIDDEVLFGTYRPYEQDMAELEAVTVEAALEVVNDVFADNRMSQVTVGPYHPN